MGDRANVYVKEDETSGVYLYTHWGGHDLPETVRLALDSDQGRNRANDNQYLARIIFCRMVGPGNLSREDGFGISANMGDNEHPVIVVEPANKRIGFAAEPKHGAVPVPDKWQSFDAYCAQKQAEFPPR